MKLGKVWREIIKRNDTHYTTLYPIYFSGTSLRTSSLEAEHAPRSRQEAERIAKALVEDESTEWTHAVIWEMRAVCRFGRSWERED